eukprot:TRINITY_DN22324_c0_g1_i1.p1 TRINITY_DN22324_c0_g1~~TRINITY_DN22324_c0_g1_i1.p1  ORF type:complete len:211 (+),score=29.36 TRINITY_DN22324_c0_g1_i1:43-633(+)
MVLFYLVLVVSLVASQSTWPADYTATYSTSPGDPNGNQALVDSVNYRVRLLSTSSSVSTSVFACGGLPSCIIYDINTNNPPGQQCQQRTIPQSQFWFNIKHYYGFPFELLETGLQGYTQTGLNVWVHQDSDANGDCHLPYINRWTLTWDGYPQQWYSNHTIGEIDCQPYSTNYYWTFVPGAPPASSFFDVVNQYCQ